MIAYTWNDLKGGCRVYFNRKEDIIRLTPLWTGERLPDGRPLVPASLLERLRHITFEEAWGPLWSRGYCFQTESNFRMSHPDAKYTMVGRAVTAVMAPTRPDLHQALTDIGKDEGRKGFYNQWIIDSLIEDDVVVVDLYDKIYKGTYVGGNLSTAISRRTKRGGAVIWGGVRDLEQIVKLENYHSFFRGVHPTGIGDCLMLGMNVPCRVGEAICLPGDVVVGTISGVVFIPAHLAEIVAIGAEKSHVRDIFGFQRLRESVYTTAQIDTQWTLAMMNDFLSWLKTDERAAGFAHLEWSEETKKAEDHEAKG